MLRESELEVQTAGAAQSAQIHRNNLAGANVVRSRHITWRVTNATRHAVPLTSDWEGLNSKGY